MILKIPSNWQMPRLCRMIGQKRILDCRIKQDDKRSLRQYIRQSYSGSSNHQHHQSQLFPLSNKYYYRSQQKFIDFRKDYYEVMGVNENAQFQQIKLRFYHLAKEYHPDRKKGNQSKFQQINEAYNILSQPNLRKEYDLGRLKEDEQETQSNTLRNQQNQSLNYEPYSQMSKAQWAVYRSGYMKHNKTDYTNYLKTYDEQKDNTYKIRQRQQWSRSFSLLKQQQIAQQINFRQKLYKKYRQDLQAQKDAKQSYIDSRLQSIGDKIERLMGKTMRNYYDKLISK